MKIEILGMGCSKCNKLEELVKTVVKELQTNIEVVKVSDIKEIMKYKVMLTPAVVVNGKVKSSGILPKIEEIKKWIKEENV
jgi:small redox-active disulfide protein 2